MEKEQLYPIGKVCKICDVSQRMLRYYEKIGLITPDWIAEPSHYRYYGIKTMLKIQTVRYLMDSGFTLEEIKNIFREDDMSRVQKIFENKITETDDKIKYYHQRLDSLKNWCALIIEGKWVLNHRQQSISTKYIPRRSCFYYGREQSAGEADAHEYLETEYFTASKQGGHSMVDVGGAFYVKYDSARERIDNTYTYAELFQIIYPNNKSMQNVIDFGGFMAVSGYHLGSPFEIRRTYEQLIMWAEMHRFRLRGDCIERQVLDRYTTGSSENYVTELLLPIDENYEDFALLEKWQPIN